jgi:endoglucanase
MRKILSAATFLATVAMSADAQSPPATFVPVASEPTQTTTFSPDSEATATSTTASLASADLALAESEIALARQETAVPTQDASLIATLLDEATTRLQDARARLQGEATDAPVPVATRPLATPSSASIPAPVTPATASPAPASPSETVSAPASPSQAAPGPASLSAATPAPPSPSEAVSAPASPSQTALGPASLSAAAPAPASPSEAVSAPASPSQAAPGPASLSAATPAALPAAPTAAAVCSSLPSVQTLLPCGPLHTAGSQVVDQQNRPVRLNCTAWWGDLANPDQQMLTLVTAGFNCLRVSYFNRTIADDLAMIDAAVASAAKLSVRIIVNNHANEGDGNCVAQQANGLWYDKGGASNGTDGCGATGRVDDVKWISDWVSVARHYKGNDTIAGYDLWNEPTNYGKGSNWGSGDINHDIRLAYQRAGNAIQAVDSDKLIIAEGSQQYPDAPEGDLRPIPQAPVVLTVPNKVVYSVHEYPTAVSGAANSSGAPYIERMNAVWGYLITQNIAPVWVGECGASMASADETAWADTLTSYLNGSAPGGLTIPAGGQGVGTDWWMWSNCDSCGNPNGALMADRTTPRPEQSAVYSKMVQRPLAGASAAGVTSAAFAAQATILSATALPSPAPAAAAP